jgi:hypothetical protein
MYGAICSRCVPRWPSSEKASNLTPFERRTPTAEQAHESAGLVADNFTAFYDAYREWIKRGFAPTVGRGSDNSA